MKFSLEVGDVEKHQIDFSFNQFLGGITIKVDGETVLSDLIYRHIEGFERLVINHTFDIPGSEKLSVRIQQIGAPVLAGLFPYTYKVFVKGNLVKTIRGY